MTCLASELLPMPAFVMSGLSVSNDAVRYALYRVEVNAERERNRLVELHPNRQFDHQSSGLASSLPPMAVQDSACLGSSKMAVIIFELTIHEDILHSFRKLSRVFVRSVVLNSCRIKNRDVGKITFLQQAAIPQPFALRRQR